jgi:serine/threonine protein kinase
VNQRIGSYHIERVLAEGGMGRVYKGRHERLGRDAAIKTLLPPKAADAAMRHRLLREAQAQARLHHPNIVAVYDLIDDEATGGLFIAMEYVDGETLAALLDRHPGSCLPLDEAFALFDQMLDALAYVHAERIVHRDVKPSNVMVCGGRVKLADFGIALLAEMPRMTSSRYVVGSPPYMSPEQLEGAPIDHRSDIYSAALVLYRMLAGRLPFEATEILAQVHERLAGAPRLRTFLPAIQAGVCDAVAIALKHDREQRFDSIAAFRNALHEGRAGFLTTASPPSDDATPTVVRDPVAPEPVEIAPEHDTRTTTAVATIVVIGTMVAAGSLLIDRSPDLPFPATAPPQKIIVAANPVPVLIEAPAPQSSQSPVTPSVKQPPFPAPTEPVEDAGAKLLRELAALREEIRKGLETVDRDLAAARYDAATEELDRIGELAQRHRDELAQERDAITRMRGVVNESQRAAKEREAEAEKWATRLAEIEEDLRAERWPEAERFANRILNDLRAPEETAARARVLLQQAKDGRRNAFKDTQLGTTTSTIRKPSSPPRKDK